jgi:hypothetical protein
MDCTGAGHAWLCLARQTSASIFQTASGQSQKAEQPEGSPMAKVDGNQSQLSR